MRPETYMHLVPNRDDLALEKHYARAQQQTLHACSSNPVLGNILPCTMASPGQILAVTDMDNIKRSSSGIEANFCNARLRQCYPNASTTNPAE